MLGLGLLIVVFMLMFIYSIIPTPLHAQMSMHGLNGLDLRREAWEAAAQEYRLTYRDNRHDNMMQIDDHHLKGHIDGNTLAISSRHHSFKPGQAKLHGRFAFQRALLAPGLKIVPRSLSNLPFKGVKTGDHTFDKRFYVRANDPQQALQLLNSGARQALLELFEHVPHLVLTSSGLKWGASSPGSCFVYAANGIGLAETLQALGALNRELHAAQQQTAVFDHLEEEHSEVAIVEQVLKS